MDIQQLDMEFWQLQSPVFQFLLESNLHKSQDDQYEHQQKQFYQNDCYSDEKHIEVFHLLQWKQQYPVGPHHILNQNQVNKSDFMH